MMPHPERAIEMALGGYDGSVLFRSLMAAMALA
jgi:phosphoribosylformylglycinamidine (FGAM) synthase-like amidotransferase family enzyme